MTAAVYARPALSARTSARVRVLLYRVYVRVCVYILYTHAVFVTCVCAASVAGAAGSHVGRAAAEGPSQLAFFAPRLREVETAARGGREKIHSRMKVYYVRTRQTGQRCCAMAAGEEGGGK